MGKEALMSIRRLMAAAGVLAVALAAAPMSALHSQTPSQDSASKRTWGVNPGPTRAPGSTTTPGSTSTVPQATTIPQAQGLVRADSAFIRQATEGNLFELRLGNLAKTKGTNPAVRQFAQRMVTDHTTMQNQWGALVARNGLPLKASLDPAHEQGALQLERLSGAEFDRVYMTSMIQAHQLDLNTFQTLGPTAQSAEVRQMAANGVPTIQQHLSMATQVGSQVGATTAVATVPQNPPTTVGNGQATTQPGKGRKNDLKADSKFVQETLQDDVLELRLAQLAEQKATKPAVKQFAQRLISDYTRSHAQWSGVATSSGVSVQTAIGPKHRDKLERLQKTSGAEFDRTYMATVIEHLQSIVPYFQKEGRNSRSSQVRSLVESELPTLQQNLAQAKRVGGQVNVSVKE
jgi:putative membrane protein